MGAALRGNRRCGTKPHSSLSPVASFWTVQNRKASCNPLAESRSPNSWSLRDLAAARKLASACVWVKTTAPHVNTGNRHAIPSRNRRDATALLWPGSGIPESDGGIKIDPGEGANSQGQQTLRNELLHLTAAQGRFPSLFGCMRTAVI